MRQQRPPEPMNGREPQTKEPVRGESLKGAGEITNKLILTGKYIKFDAL